MSQENSPSIPPKNSQTSAVRAIDLASAKEAVKVTRPDLGVTLEIRLDATGDEPRWHLTGTFTKLETAIRFIQTKQHNHYIKRGLMLGVMTNTCPPNGNFYFH